MLEQLIFVTAHYMAKIYEFYFFNHCSNFWCILKTLQYDIVGYVINPGYGDNTTSQIVVYTRYL